MQPNRESGAVLVTVGLTMFTLLGIAALVIDLAAIRLDRTTASVAADSAAAAGAVEAARGDAKLGCEIALDYVELHLKSTSFSASDCAKFSAACTPTANAIREMTATSGNWHVTIQHPVLDSSSMLAPTSTGTPSQSIARQDGTPCERFAVGVKVTTDYTFAGILGVTQHNSDIVSVAKAHELNGSVVTPSVLLLERYKCSVLTVSGNGEITVGAALDPITNNLAPGLIAIVSDASDSCTSDGTIDTNENGSIRADGPAGCPAQTGTHVGPAGLPAGNGCGQILLHAPGVPGCNYPACTSTGTISPTPNVLPQPMTRAPIDHHYNCRPSYPLPAGWEIEGCQGIPAPHIDDLVRRYGPTAGTPPGFTTWTSAGHRCNPDTLSVQGNWLIDCRNFNPKGAVTFEGGDVIFEGNVGLSGKGSLGLNSTSAHTPASSESIAYFRSGAITKSGQSTFIAHNTTVYLSNTSSFKLSGGTGTLRWTPPTTGDFQALALWSESDLAHEFAGQATLDLQGLFFAPWAHISFQGNGGQQQVEAQFVSRTLSLAGNGGLRLHPNGQRLATFRIQPTAELIR